MFQLLALVALGTPQLAEAKDKFDPGSVQTVAMFGFGGTVEIEATATKTGIGILDTVNEVKKVDETVDALHSGELRDYAAQQGIDAFVAVEAGLEDAFGWDVTGWETLRDDEAYAAVVEANTMKGKLGAMAEAWGAGMCPPGLLHHEKAMWLKMDDRDALIDALGVDALVIADVAITGKDRGVSVGGVGTSRVKPKALVTVQIFTKGEKKKVWRGSVQGPKTDEAIKKDFGGSTGEDAEIYVDAITKGMDKFADKFAPES